MSPLVLPLAEVVGWLGVVLYLVAYASVSSGRMDGQGRLFQSLNLAGAAGVATNAFYYGALPSAVVNVVWFGIAVWTLARIETPVAEREGPSRGGR